MVGTAINARELMEQAVQVMRRSVAEPRADGKSNPLVGAALWEPDGNVETAYRDEFRDGDHAEYTLLERKKQTAKLDNAVLFVTLEPCAPGARQYPKLSCAERIVLARIKEVWVGIEDPDPTVDRRGIRYLQENGVAVNMFDLDLQREIRDANKPFLEQAIARAEAQEEGEPVEAPSLSSLERAIPSVDFRDFSSEALERYRQTANIDHPTESAVFLRRLLHLGLLEESAGGRTGPTGFGLLLFGREPRPALPQAGLLATIQLEDGREEVRDFDGPQVFAPEQALQWLRDRLPNPIDRSDARRVEVNKRLWEMVREAVVNALIHRDYSIKGAKCQLIATKDTINVMSPGEPVEPITLEQMRSLNAPMLSRNPVLHYVFSRMELAEERGLGLKSLRDGAESAGLPLPRYKWVPPYLSLTIYRNAAALAAELSGPAELERLTGDRKTVWEIASARDEITTRELIERTGYDERKIQRILADLRDDGLLQRTGNGRATRYEVCQSGGHSRPQSD